MNTSAEQMGISTLHATHKTDHECRLSSASIKGKSLVEQLEQGQGPDDLKKSC